MTSKCENAECTWNLSESEETCPNCGAYAGPPNVRVATTLEELEALEKRYQSALGSAIKEGAAEILAKFEAAVKESVAVVACDLPLLLRLLTEQQYLYNNFHNAVNIFVQPDESYYKRQIVEAYLFPGYEKKIIYAALSLDGRGLTNYGRKHTNDHPYFIELSDYAVKIRSTVMEENSYIFAKKHMNVKELNFKPVPLGFRTVWRDRHRLAVAKLADRFTSNTTPADFPHLLLINGSNRETDDFIEILMYGTFSGEAIRKVSGPRRREAQTKVDGGDETMAEATRAQAAVLEEILRIRGKIWVPLD